MIYKIMVVKIERDDLRKKAYSKTAVIHPKTDETIEINDDSFLMEIINKVHWKRSEKSNKCKR